MRTDTIENLLTLPLVAERLHTSPRSVRRLVQSRRLAPIRIPGVRGYRFRPSAIEALIENAIEVSLPEKAMGL